MTTDNSFPSFDLLHSQNPSGLEKAWLLTGSDRTPNRQRCSIGAALQSGLVARSVKPGHIWFRDHGILPAETAIALGHIDQAAADIVAGQVACYRPPAELAVPLAVHVPARRPGTLQEFERTPLGDFLAALQTWRMSPGVDEQYKLGKALERLLGTPQAS